MSNNILCPHCGGDRLWKHGVSKQGEQRYKCPSCNKAFIPDAVVRGNNCWLEPKLLEQLKARAKQQKLTLSELIQKLLDKQY